MKKKMFCSLTKLLMILFIVLNLMCNLSKSQNELDELENNFLKDKKIITNETKDNRTIYILINYSFNFSYL